MSLLDVRGINSFYGQSHILHDVSISVDDGSFVTLIGRNGAGKSTTLKSIMGIITPTSGNILFKGDEITELAPYEISKRGIAYIPETRELFNQLTVRENLRLGYLGHEIDNGVDEQLDMVFEFFPKLKELLDQRAGSLSGGEQQMATIARGLVSDPEFLLIDEPTEGLMPTLVESLREILVQINNNGKTILLVEQNVELALDVSEYGYVLDEGAITKAGPSNDLLSDEEFVNKHLVI